MSERDRAPSISCAYRHLEGAGSEVFRRSVVALPAHIATHVAARLGEVRGLVSVERVPHSSNQHISLPLNTIESERVVCARSATRLLIVPERLSMVV